MHVHARNPELAAVCMNGLELYHGHYSLLTSEILQLCGGCRRHPMTDSSRQTGVKAPSAVAERQRPRTMWQVWLHEQSVRLWRRRSRPPRPRVRITLIGQLSETCACLLELTKNALLDRLSCTVSHINGEADRAV